MNSLASWHLTERRRKIKRFSGLDAAILDVHIFSSIQLSQTNGVIKSFCGDDTISEHSSAFALKREIYQLANIYRLSTICQHRARHERTVENNVKRVDVGDNGSMEYCAGLFPILPAVYPGCCLCLNKEECYLVPSCLRLVQVHFLHSSGPLAQR